MAPTHVIERRDFDRLFEALAARGHTIIGPTVRDQAIVYDEISSVGDLPRDGRTSRHRAGAAETRAAVAARGQLGTSTHGIGLGEAVRLAVRLGRLPARLVIYTIEGARFELGAGLSAEVRAAIPRLVRLVRDEVMALSKPT